MNVVNALVERFVKWRCHRRAKTYLKLNGWVELIPGGWHDTNGQRRPLLTTEEAIREEKARWFAT